MDIVDQGFLNPNKAINKKRNMIKERIKNLIKSKLESLQSRKAYSKK